MFRLLALFLCLTAVDITICRTVHLLEIGVAALESGNTSRLKMNQKVQSLSVGLSW